jgi:nucleotide-binding universal stress UspA family protein
MKLRAILCPTDFSKSSEEALAYGSYLAEETGARLYLLHVVDESAAYTTEYTGMGYLADFTQQIEHESQALLEAVSPPLSEVEFERHLLLGTPARTIIEFADEHDVDLVVMGSHGRSGLSRLLLGSVVDTVVRTAHCPVLTVRPREDHSTSNAGSGTESTPVTTGSS